MFLRAIKNPLSGGLMYVFVFLLTVRCTGIRRITLAMNLTITLAPGLNRCSGAGGKRLRVYTPPCAIRTRTISCAGNRLSAGDGGNGWAGKGDKNKNKLFHDIGVVSAMVD